MSFELCFVRKWHKQPLLHLYITVPQTYSIPSCLCSESLPILKVHIILVTLGGKWCLITGYGLIVLSRCYSDLSWEWLYKIGCTKIIWMGEKSSMADCIVIWTVIEIVIREMQAWNYSYLNEMIKNKVKYQYSVKLKALTRKLKALTKS